MMKYVKPILIVAFMAAVTGFVVWHLIWMTGIEKKYKVGQASGEVNKVAVKERNHGGQKGETEKNGLIGEGVMSDRENRHQISQTVTLQKGTERQGGNNVDAGARMPVEETKPGPVKEERKWFEKDIGLGGKKQEVKTGTEETTIEIQNDKTMSVTIKNKAKPVNQKSTPKPQLMPIPSVKVTGVTPYPTSTAP